MSLPRDVYWWIENEKGELVPYGREILSGDPTIWETGAPNPEYYRRNIKPLCREGEHPVKIKIVRVN